MEEKRIGEIQRRTRETEVLVQIELDGTGNHQIDTEIPFLSHMLTLLAVHSLCNLNVSARVAMDLSGRSCLVYQVDLEREQLGNLAVENIKEFFQALVNHAGINLHIDLLRGGNTHHKIEAIFKAFARALKTAVDREERIEGAWSSKGNL